MTTTSNPFDWERRRARRARNGTGLSPHDSDGQASRQPDLPAQSREGRMGKSRESRESRNQPSYLPDRSRGQPQPASASSPQPSFPPSSAMRREGSRSRVPHLRPDFPDEGSYLGSNAPDLERKNRPADRQFREKRDGYESGEGEAHRKAKDGRRRAAQDGDRDTAAAPRRREVKAYDEIEPRRRRRDDDYNDAVPLRSRRDDDHNDNAPQRRRRDEDYQDEPPRQRRTNHNDDGYTRGLDPPRRRFTERSRDYRRHDDHSDESESDHDRRRRRRSADDYQSEDRRRNDKTTRREAKDQDRDRYYDLESREVRKRREATFDRDQDTRRSDRRLDGRSDRRRHSDDDDYDRDGRRRESRPIRVGKYDITSYVDQGKKHYDTFAPIVTPIIMNLAKNYMAGKMGGRR